MPGVLDRAREPCGASSRRANSLRYIRAGSTSATYWSPAMTLRPRPLALTASDQRAASFVHARRAAAISRQEAGVLHDRGEGERAGISQTVVRRLAMPPGENERVDRLDTGVADEPGGHRRVDRLDRRWHRTQPRLVDKGLHGVPLHERREHAGEERGAQDRQEGREPPDREERAAAPAGAASTEEMLNAESSASRAASMPIAAAGSAVQAENEEEHQADSKGGTGRPEHVADVLVAGQTAADELRDEDRRLRQRGHLVAEVRAADDRASGDRLEEAEDVGHPDEGDARGCRRSSTSCR